MGSVKILDPRSELFRRLTSVPRPLHYLPDGAEMQSFMPFTVQSTPVPSCDLPHGHPHQACEKDVPVCRGTGVKSRTLASKELGSAVTNRITPPSENRVSLRLKASSPCQRNLEHHRSFSRSSPSSRSGLKRFYLNLNQGLSRNAVQRPSGAGVSTLCDRSS